jgi:hypothetical protein
MRPDADAAFPTPAARRRVAHWIKADGLLVLLLNVSGRRAKLAGIDQPTISIDMRQQAPEEAGLGLEDVDTAGLVEEVRRWEPPLVAIADPVPEPLEETVLS